MSSSRQTKTDTVRAMLTRPGGASLAAICEATGWQPHSARAVLSGLRKAGNTIAREAPTDGKGDRSVYRITASSEVAE